MSDFTPQPPAGPVTKTSVTAIISLIGGITGFTVLPFLGSIVAIITGHIAQGEIKKSNGMVTGKGLATAGLIMGYVAVAGGLCLLCLAIVLPLLGFTLTIPFLSNNYYTY